MTASAVTHADIGKVHERVNVVEQNTARAIGKIEAHETLCMERWKNQDEAWGRQEMSNQLLQRINHKMTYWSGGIAVLAFVLGLAAAAAAK